MASSLKLDTYIVVCLLGLQVVPDTGRVVKDSSSPEITNYDGCILSDTGNISDILDRYISRYSRDLKLSRTLGESIKDSSFPGFTDYGGSICSRALSYFRCSRSSKY